MQMPEVQSWNLHAADQCDGIIRMMDRNRQRKPVLLVLPGFSNTLSMLLANGPEVGMSFIISFGIPRLQQERYQGYFSYIWRKYAGCAADLPSKGHARHAQCVASPERDRMGLTLRPHPAPEKLFASRRVLRLLRDRWPRAPVAQMGLTIPPVDLGGGLPA